MLVWDPEAGRLSFEALQRRAAARARSAATLATRTPAYFVAGFDILQADGVEMLALPYRERRLRQEVLFTARGLTAPWPVDIRRGGAVRGRERRGGSHRGPKHGGWAE
ncbi:hypothetical protein [Streptomyces sp. NPDC048272]|uniref:hypothetical protein n=1 Tax=Streptomyces sp. NPDC048272 TaxID=3154616 RepID=UPI00343C83B8